MVPLDKSTEKKCGVRYDDGTVGRAVWIYGPSRDVRRQWTTVCEPRGRSWDGGVGTTRQTAGPGVREGRGLTGEGVPSESLLGDICREERGVGVSLSWGRFEEP